MVWMLRDSLDARPPLIRESLGALAPLRQEGHDMRRLVSTNAIPARSRPALRGAAGGSRCSWLEWFADRLTLPLQPRRGRRSGPMVRKSRGSSSRETGCVSIAAPDAASRSDHRRRPSCRPGDWVTSGRALAGLQGREELQALRVARERQAAVARARLEALKRGRQTRRHPGAAIRDPER